jgi:tetratricopeptide (TPR) repeat protein
MQKMYNNWYIGSVSLLLLVIGGFISPVAAMEVPSWATDHQNEFMGKYTSDTFDSLVGGEFMNSSGSDYSRNNTTTQKKSETSAIDKMVESANGLLDSKSYKEASDAFDKILAVDGTSFAANYGKGQAYEGLNKSTNALDSYRDAVRYNTRSSAPVWKAYAAEGRVKYQLGRYLQAIDDLDQGISLCSKSNDGSDEQKKALAQMWKIKGDAQTKLSKTDDAQASYAKAKELDPSVKT